MSTSKDAIKYAPTPPPGAEKMNAAVANIQKDIQKVKEYQDSLARLAEQSGGAGSTEGAVAEQLQQFRKRMTKEDEADDKAVEGIRALLEEVLSAPMIEHLTKEIEEQIAKTIDAQVKQQVAESLKEHTSEALQIDLEEYRKKIEDAQKELFNSESRRSNSLRRRDGEAQLEPLYKPNGDDASPNFPKDLETLFALDDETIRMLLRDYQLESSPAADARDFNLNAFMRHIGVMYQMKRMAGGASQPVHIPRY